MASPDNQQAEHIIQVASRLFSALGYDATSTRQIAETAGVRPSLIEDLFGGKQELYIAVMRNAFEQESVALQELLDELRCDSAADCARAIHLLIDRQLEFTAAHTYIYALRTHRWLSDAMHVAEVERYSLPILRTIMATFEPAMAAGHLSQDADLEYLLFMTHWCIQGFTMGGVPDENGVVRNHTDEREWRRFRLRLHQMAHRTLLLPGDYTPG